MSMQVTDTISYIHTSNSSVNSGGAQYNHMAGSGRWNRLTLLEKKLVGVTGVLSVVVLVLLIVVIVVSSKHC